MSTNLTRPLLFGIPLTAVLAILAAYSYRVDSFRIPATTVSGISITVVLARVVNSLAAISIGLLSLVLVWIKLSGFDPLRAEDS